MSSARFVVLLVSFAVASLAEKSPFVNFGSFVCPREEKALGRCLRDMINTYIPRLARGIPEYGIPSCEPLLVPEVTFQQTHGPVTVSSRYSELTVRGPSTMRVKEIQVTPADHKVVAQMQIPQLKIKGRYQMKGQLLVMPIEGEGLCSGDYSNVNATVTIMLDRIPRESGPDALACKALDVIFRVGNATVQLDNLFGGDQQLGGAMNKFINQNWRQVAEELQPAVESSLKDFLKPLADRAFSSLNADEILS